MNTLIFIIALAAIILLIGLAIYGQATAKFQLWPPPSGNTWQYYASWWLFRTFVAGVVILAVRDFNSFPTDIPWLRWGVGLPLLLIGLTLATVISLQLGWKNAHGEQKGLKTDGWYRYSRNPIYTVSFPALFGAALLINSLPVSILLGGWTLLYMVAPFLEEPWLAQRYGAAYLQYRNEVPRFI